MFENRVLKETPVSNREEVTAEWRKLRNDELYHMYCSPNIFRFIKSRRMRWAGHVALRGEKENCIQGYGREN